MIAVAYATDETKLWNKDIRAASQTLPQGTQNHNSLLEARL